MSKVKALYHIVFCTKKRQMVIPTEHAEDLYRFIWKEVSSMGCRLIRVGGIPNHIHMLIDLHPSVSLSHLMQAVKGHSSGWMRADNRFPLFYGWASEYYAGSVSSEHQDRVIEYIKGQREHHKLMPFDNELLSLYHTSGLDYHEQDMQ